MYSALYIQPRNEKENRIIRCEPYVAKYTVAVFILKSHRHKDKIGGVLVGDKEGLDACWNAIEQQDQHFSDDPHNVVAAISTIAQQHKCAVAFQQNTGDPTISISETTTVEARNAFLPQTTKGAITQRGVAGTDALMYDISVEQSGEKILPILHTLFNSRNGSVRGAVVAYGLEGGEQDKLFLLKGSSLVSESAALDACWNILKGTLQQKEAEEGGAAPQEPKRPKMEYFKFRL